MDEKTAFEIIWYIPCRRWTSFSISNTQFVEQICNYRDKFSVDTRTTIVTIK